jgi:hypothetical protein
MAYRVCTFALFFLIALVVAQQGRVEFDFVRTPKSCDHECVHGACSYSGCHSGSDSDYEPVSCPGGACRFEDCDDALCSGGGCEYVRCNGGRCDGGGCNFIHPKNTLAAGYCNGESCKLNGKDHPNFRHYLSV